jgi:hypothetical protein
MLTAADLRRRRFAAQGLDAACACPVDAVRGVLAVQAQELRSARLAVRARSTGLFARDIDAALTDKRTLVVSWLVRGTLHLVHRDDYPWLWALTPPATISANRRRLVEEGVPTADAERALAIIERALTDNGPLPRADLAERLARAGIRTAGQATPHVLMLAALRGLVVLGPVRDGAQAIALTRDWLGSQPAALSGDDRVQALAELVRRYLRGHGPASVADIAAWSGIGLRDVRDGLRQIDGELDEDGDLLDLAAREARPPGAMPCRLLPPFDPYLLGWRDRGFIVADENLRRVYPGGGMLRATAVIEGRAVATWTLQRRGGRVHVEVDVFDDLDTAAEATLWAEADDVARFQAGPAGND